MYSSLTVLAIAAFSAEVSALTARNYSPKTYKHVAVFSVDGMHSSDVEKYLAIRPSSNMAMLLNHGYEFTDAYTSAPSDSFPGTVAQYTGASPRISGVWYDDTYDRSYFDPGSNCKGAPGAEVVYDESIDYNSTELFSGGIDPENLPQTLINGKCTNIYPHMRLRVNTVFEVVRAAGLQTAYTDKHPAYDLVRGPSGTGLSEGYFPEIAAVANNVNATIAYDQLHVNAFLAWINGTSPQHAEGSITQIPALFGGNFQCVNVAQKTVGYNKDQSFSSALIQAFDFVDASLGKVVAALKAKNVYSDTLIIVASKHGQAPINPALYNTVPPKTVTNATNVKVAFQTSDDIALLFLANQSDVSKAVAGLNNARTSAKILNIIYGSNLTAQGYGNPVTDPAVPDIIVQPQLGTIYTTSTKKVAEHGGLSDDDRVVACFISNPSLPKKQFTQRVSTQQVAPTILEALGLNPYALQGVVAEGTKSLFEACQWW